MKTNKQKFINKKKTNNNRRKNWEHFMNTVLATNCRQDIWYCSLNSHSLYLQLFLTSALTLVKQHHSFRNLNFMTKVGKVCNLFFVSKVKKALEKLHKTESTHCITNMHFTSLVNIFRYEFNFLKPRGYYMYHLL